MAKRLLTLFVFILFSPLMINQVMADSVTPTGRDTPIISTYDLSTPPSQINIWTKESGGYDTSNWGLWGRNNWRCLSNSNPKTGQCKSGEASTAGGDWGIQGKTTIPLLFTEKRTGLQVVINVEGYHLMSNSQFLVTAAGNITLTPETFLYTYIKQDELKKFPTGGVWEANLQLQLWQWSPGKKLADWKANITLNVTDNNNQQIYLPEFGSAKPLVDLNLRPVPGTGGKTSQMHGTANIDMCLYDGYNSQSSAFFITMQDKAYGISTRGDRDFSIVRDGGKTSSAADVINYTIEMLVPVINSYRSISRTDELVIENIQQAKVRQVHISGIPQPVLCVPAPLKLQTEWMDINTKRAGHYTGILEITFTTIL